MQLLSIKLYNYEVDNYVYLVYKHSSRTHIALLSFLQLFQLLSFLNSIVLAISNLSQNLDITHTIHQSHQITESLQNF